MPFTVTEIVFQVVAFGFQGVVVFIFDFPAGATGLYDAGDIVCGKDMVCDEGIVVEDFASDFMGDDQFAPIDVQGIVAIAQRELVDEAIVPDFPVFAIPAGPGKSLDRTLLLEIGQALVQTGV